MGIHQIVSSTEKGQGKERLCAEPSKAAARAPKAGSRRQAQSALKATTAQATGEEVAVGARPRARRVLAAHPAPGASHRGRSRRRFQPKHRARHGRFPLLPRPRPEAFIHSEASSRRAPSSPPFPLLRSSEAATTHVPGRLGRRGQALPYPASARLPPARRHGAGALPGRRRGVRPRALPRAWPAARPAAAAGAPPAPRPPWLRGRRAAAAPAPYCACAATPGATNPPSNALPSG